MLEAIAPLDNAIASKTATKIGNAYHIFLFLSTSPFEVPKKINRGKPIFDENFKAILKFFYGFIEVEESPVNFRLNDASDFRLCTSFVPNWRRFVKQRKLVGLLTRFSINLRAIDY